jgi:IclR family acetate operon transcriptional repressor
MTTSSASYIFDILRLIGAEHQPLGATDVSERLSLPLTTAHRGLSTLERANYIVRYQSSTKFVLGEMSRKLLHSFFARFAIRSVAIPTMHRLVAVTGETVSLFVPVGWYGVRIALVKGTNEVIRTGPVGEAWALEKNAAGLALLAFRAEREQMRFLHTLERRTSAAERARLENELKLVRDQHYAVINDPARHELSIPVLARDEASPGALTIEGSVAPSSLDTCLSIVARLSELVAAEPERYRKVYDHLDPDAVTLPSVG